MKPDWDDLGETFENSKKVLIADVDCTVDANKQLCEDHGVKGYPTIKYYNPGDRDGVVYEGDRSLPELKKFCKTLGPPCSPTHLNKCTAEQKVELASYLAMPVDELSAKIAADKKELEDTEATHNALLKELQDKFQESENALKALKDAKAPALKLMKVALTNLTAAAAAPAEAKEEL